MNEPIQINVKITADKPLIKILEALVAALGSKPSAKAPEKATETPQGPAGAEEANENPQTPEAAPSEPEDDDPGFDGTLPPVTVEDCIKAAKMAKDSGVPIDAIRATVARYGVSRPQDVPADKLGELFDALSALGAKK